MAFEFDEKTASPVGEFDASTAAPVKPRSALAEIGNQLYAGTVADLPQMAGQAAQYLSSPGNTVYETGKKLADAAKARGQRADLQPDTDNHNIVTNTLASGARMIPQSILPAAAVGGALAALPLEVPALAGVGAAALLGSMPAAFSQGQQTLDKAKEAGVSDEIAIPAARKTALIEGAGETLGTIAGAKLLGVGGKAISTTVNRALGRAEGTAAGRALEDATSRSVVKPFAKQFPETLATEVGTEMGQNAGEAYVEQQAGIDKQTPGEAAIEAIQPTIGMTALLAPFGLAGHGLRARANARRADTLASAEASPEQRTQAAEAIQKQIATVNPEAAQNFGLHAGQAIDNAQPLAIGEHLFAAPKPETLPGAAPEQPKTFQTDATVAAPDLTTEPGAGIPPAGNAIDFEHSADTSGLDLVPRESKPSEAMGIDATAGPMSKAAAIAVDSGAHAEHLQRQAQLAAAETANDKNAATSKTEAPAQAGPLAGATQPGPATAAAPDSALVPAPAPLATTLPAQPAGSDTAVATRAALQPNPTLGAPNVETTQVQPGLPGTQTAPASAAARDTGAPANTDAGVRGASGSGKSESTNVGRKDRVIPAAIPAAGVSRTAEPAAPSLKEVANANPEGKGQAPAGERAAPVQRAADRVEPQALRSETASTPDGTGSPAGGAQQVVAGPFRTRLAANPALKKAGAGHEIAATAEGGFVVRKVAQTEKAPVEAKPLSVGITPATTEPVTVKNGVVHIGKEPALNFDSGEPVTVKAGAAESDIRKALKDAGALSKRQKFFGGSDKAEADPPIGTEAPPAVASTTSPVAGQARQVDQAGSVPANDEHVGVDGVPIAEGGKPFASKLRAVQHQRQYMKQGRVVKSGDGFAVRPATDKEVDARAKSGKALARAGRGAAWDKNPLLAWIGSNGGLSVKHKRELSPDANPLILGGAMFRTGGKPLDTLAHSASVEGFLPKGSEDERALRELVVRALSGERITAINAEGAAESEADKRIAAMQELRENEFDVLDEADIPWDSKESNVSTKSAMQSMGFTEQEISDEIARESRGAQADSASSVRSDETAAGPAQESDRSGESAPGATEGLSERFEAGKALSKEQRKAVLATLTDVYKTKRAPKEFKGVGRDGNERYGYAHSPDLFEKSDITGAMVRYHVTLPDGRRAHPTELFPDYTQSDIDAELTRRVADAATKASEVKRMTKPEQLFDSVVQAGRYWDEKSDDSLRAHGQWRTISPSLDRTSLTNGEKFIMVPSDVLKNGAMVEAFAEAGWTRTGEGLTAPTREDILAQQQRAEQSASLDEKQQVDREAADQTLTRPAAPEQRKDTTGDLLGGLSADDIQRGQNELGEVRRKLVDLENQIVGKAGLAPGFIEDALRSRKVPQEMKAQREVLKSRIAELRLQVGEKSAPKPQRDDGTAPMFARDERNLIVQHNITAENLMHADRMGGLAVPSLAITKVNDPLENFGEITLLGDRDMATPSRDTKVFGADIYSPRYPNVQYKPDSASLKKIRAVLDPLYKEGEYRLSEVRQLDDLTSDKAFIRYADKKAGGSASWAQLKEEAGKMLREVGAEERIFQGFTDSGNRRYKAHTLDNVIAILKKELRGGENFNYGAGSLRAKFTPQFRTLAQIRASKDRLITKAEFEKLKDEVNTELLDLAYNMVPDRGFSSSDTGISILEEGAKIGLRKAAQSYDIELSDEQVQRASDFLNKLRNLPTQYFEAKVLRAMDVGEFKAAVVPSDLSTEARTLLERKGLTLYEYKQGDDADRARVVKEAAKATPDALFKRESAKGGLSKPDANRVVMSLRAAGLGKLQMVETIADLPESGRKRIQSEGDIGVRGMYDPGTDTTYLVREHLKNDVEAISTGLHEAFHRGLRKTFGSAEIDPILRFMYRSNPELRRMADERAAQFGITVEEATEEALADLSGTGVAADLKGWDRLLEFIRKVVTKIAARLKVDYELTGPQLMQFVAGIRREGMRDASQREVQVDGVWRPIENSAGQPIVANHDMQKLRNFWKFFGDSKVVDEQGRPLVVYHGTHHEAFDRFDPERTEDGAFHFGTARAAWDAVEQNPDYEEGDSPHLMPVYLSIKNPMRVADQDSEWDKAIADAKRKGHDGIVYANAHEDKGRDSYIAFSPNQIKSATGNNGDFNPANPDIQFSRVAGQTARQYTPDQQAAMKHVGFAVDPVPLKDKLQGLWKSAGKTLAQGIVDQFAPVKDISKDAYALLRLSKGASGAFEVLLRGGELKLTEGVYDFNTMKKGGVIDKLLIPLQGEHHDFLRWVAANRAEHLTGQGKEHLFTASDIAALKSLDTGVTAFDYTLRNDIHGVKAGTVTRDRTLIYRDSQVVFQQFNKNTLDMAEQSGLIDAEARKVWESEFYVPFYRVADEDGTIRGMNVKSGVVRQQAFKALKGGTQQINADLLDNTLMNWAHLLDAAAKNRAAAATLQAMEKVGAAVEAPEEAARQMGKSIGKPNGVVWYMDQGKQRFYLVDDPHLMTAVSALEFAGMNGPMMKAMGALKHALTIGVTASPFFKVRNLIRDSVQAIGTSSLGFNPAANIAQGWALTNPQADAHFRLLAGGGTIHFGTMYEGSEAKRVQALVESGIKDATILNTPDKLKAFYRHYVEPTITAYNELGNRGEEINRAALYDQLVKGGMGHAEAALQARDLMDFSMQGSFATVRFLTQTVPFLNARLQGLYKLGRATKEDPAKIGIVLGATALLSLGLLAAYHDDDDWKKRELWDRQGFWWFKVGGTAFRIPKPFEIGAIASLAEGGFETAFTDNLTGKDFRQMVMGLVGDNLSMNPIPQLVKPMLDVYANVDSFTGRPIESMGMERLKSEYRFNSNTSMAARAASTAMNAVTGIVDKEAPSPVQIDHLLRGYFGWLGTFVVQAADVLARPATSQPERPASDMVKAATGGMAANLDDAQSRYVSSMYQQAKSLEQAYGTWRQLLKEGKGPEAAAFREDHADELAKYHQVEAVKRQESRLNERIRMVERGDASPDEKRDQIRNLNRMKDAVARRLAA